MSFIYYVCVAENSKILFQSGESAKYGRYAELAITRCQGAQKRCFEIDTTPEAAMAVMVDLNTTWIAITDTEVMLSLTFSLLMGLQQPWRSMNRPLQFGRVIDEKIAIYTSADEEKQATMVDEVHQYGHIANEVKLEPISCLLKRKENLDDLLVQVDNELSDDPDARSREQRKWVRLYITVLVGLIAIAWSVFFISCGLHAQHCT